MKKILTLILIINSLCSFAQFGKEHYIDFINPYNQYPNVSEKEIKCAADFDEDGYKDIIYCMSENFYPSYPQIALIKNNHGTSFSRPKIIYNFSASDSRYYSVFQIKAADFNNDGKMDFIVFFASFSVPTDAGKVVWFKNMGNDVFQENLINGLSGWGDYMDVVDMDHNGYKDVLVTSHYLDNLNVAHDYIYLAKNTNGVFTLKNISASTSFDAAAAGDLDNDGYIDFVAGSSTSSDLIYWFKNNADTSFTQKQSLATITTSYKKKIIDVDNDGFKDIIYCDYPSTSSSYLTFYKIKNLGNGTFAPAVVISQNAINYNNVNANWDIIDVDGDGLLDISIINSDFNSYLKNLGNFTFGSSLTTFNMPSTVQNGFTYPKHWGTYIFDDFNNDNVNDIAIISYDSLWLCTKSTNGYEIAHSKAIPPVRMDLISALDIDNDNDIDVVASGLYNGSSIFKYNNLGSGKFADPVVAVDSAYSATILLNGKINNDNTSDLVYYSPAKNVIYLSKNNAGIFSAPQPVVSGISLDTFVLADIDKDNDLDIVGFKNTEVFDFLNDGNGNFGAKNTVYNFSGKINYLVVNDWDNDNKNDIIFSSYESNKIIWLKNTATNTFTATPVNYSFNRPYTFAIADMDGDTKKDLIVNDYSAFYLLYNNNFTFTSAQTLNANSLGVNGYMKIEDIDGDGDNDIVLNLALQASIFGYYIYENDGIGNFTSRSTSSSLSCSPEDLIIKDVDNDGDKDFITFNAGYAGDIVWTDTKYSSAGTAKATVFWDANNNQKFDAGELTLRNQRVNLNQTGADYFTSNNGVVYFLNLYGTYSTSFTVPANWVLTTPNTLYTFTLPSDTSINMLYGLKPSASITSYRPSITAGLAKCAQNTLFKFDVNNEGTVTKKVKVEILYDTALQYISSLITPDTISKGRVVYVVSNLQPTYLKSFGMEFKMPGFSPVGTNIYPVKVNTYTLESNNQYAYNITDSLPVLIKCAFDPNDKAADPIGIVPDKHYTKKTETMEYTIRFQNTGNDTARNIFITDTLSSWYGVWNYHSPFKIVSSSHTVTKCYIVHDNILHIELRGINLPDSGKDYKNSQGYVRFSVIPPSTIPDFTLVKNNAHITFDRNPPVATNEVFNTFITSLTANLYSDFSISYTGGSTITPGATYPATVTLKNTGNISNSCVVKFFLYYGGCGINSTPVNADTTSYYLAPNQQITFNRDIHFPASGLSPPYYGLSSNLYTVNAADEKNTSNDFYCKILNLVQKDSTDILASALTSRDTAMINDTLSIGTTLKNNGLKNIQQYKYKIILSKDSVLSSDDSLLFGSAAFNNLNSDSSKTFINKVRVSALDTGKLYILLVADSLTGEINFANNKRLKTIYMKKSVVYAGPDQTICGEQATTLTATGATSYVWSTGATTANITVAPFATTSYIVTGTTNNISQKDTVVLTVKTRLFLSVASDTSRICLGDSVRVYAISPDTLVSWNTGQLTKQITVSPIANTKYIATVKGNGCYKTDSVTITVKPLPNVNFTKLLNGANIQLTAPNGNTSYTWNFGDGTPTFSTQNPSHTYATNGKKYITLSSILNGCSAQKTDSVTITITAIKNNISFVDKIDVFPNPTDNFVTIELNSKKSTTFNVILISVDGKVIINKDYKNTAIINDKLDLKDYSAGVYILQIQAENQQATYQIIKK